MLPAGDARTRLAKPPTPATRGTRIILATLGLFHVAIGIGAVLRFWVRIR